MSDVKNPRSLSFSYISLTSPISESTWVGVGEVGTLSLLSSLLSLVGAIITSFVLVVFVTIWLLVLLSSHDTRARRSHRVFGPYVPAQSWFLSCTIPCLIWNWSIVSMRVLLYLPSIGHEYALALVSNFWTILISSSSLPIQIGILNGSNAVLVPDASQTLSLWGFLHDDDIISKLVVSGKLVLVSKST